MTDQPVTLRQIEAIPASYPAVEGVTGAALVIAWQRIEHYVAWRFSPREVTWHVASPGCPWRAPLAPVVTLTVAVDGQAPYVPESGPFGGEWALPCGDATVTAIVGAAPVPEGVAEAVRRYAAFLAAVNSADAPPPGLTRIESGELSLAFRADERSLARAMVSSGAADLLRGYRRV